MKFRYLILFLLAGLSAQAQSASASGNVMDAFVAKLHAFPALELSFTCNEVEGELFMQGNMFRLTTANYEIFCNHTDKWSYNKEIEEVVLVPNDTASTDLLENPLAFFMNRNDDYRIPAHATTLITDNHELWKLILTPANKSANYESITLFIHKKNSELHAISCRLMDGTVYDIQIGAYRRAEPRDVRWFTFLPEEHPDAYMVDLR